MHTPLWHAKIAVLLIHPLLRLWAPRTYWIWWYEILLKHWFQNSPKSTALKVSMWHSRFIQQRNILLATLKLKVKNWERVSSSIYQKYICKSYILKLEIQIVLLNLLVYRSNKQDSKITKYYVKTNKFINQLSSSKFFKSLSKIY